MKGFIKTALVFCGLSMAFSILYGCGFSTATGSRVEKKETENVKEKKSGAVYPSAPKAIATANFKMLDGKDFNLEENKGKVILINLWATWCGPCRKEMPDLVEMQEKYRDKGFEIIGLDTDPETEEQVTAFKDEMKLNYRLGWAERELVQEFFKLGQMGGIPQSFLINREGQLTGMFRGGGEAEVAKMKKRVEEIVNE